MVILHCMAVPATFRTDIVGKFILSGSQPTGCVFHLANWLRRYPMMAKQGDGRSKAEHCGTSEQDGRNPCSTRQVWAGQFVWSSGRRVFVHRHGAPRFGGRQEKSTDQILRR